MTHTTDSLKALARRTGLTVSALRATADDLGLTTAYNPARRTWFIAEPAATVTAFNRHVAA